MIKGWKPHFLLLLLLVHAWICDKHTCLTPSLNFSVLEFPSEFIENEINMPIFSSNLDPKFDFLIHKCFVSANLISRS